MAHNALDLDLAYYREGILKSCLKFLMDDVSVISIEL